jgi:hypothetical protein
MRCWRRASEASRTCCARAPAPPRYAIETTSSNRILWFEPGAKIRVGIPPLEASTPAPAYLNQGLRQVWGGEWLRGGELPIAPRMPGLIWVLDHGSAT